MTVRLLLVAGAGAVLLALSAALAGAGSGGGTPPPELAANAGSLAVAQPRTSRTRGRPRHTDRRRRRLASLKQRWTFSLPYVGGYGAFTSNPIVLGGVVYLEDPDSDVFALRRQTGALLWQHDYHSVTPSGGPNGVALRLRAPVRRDRGFASSRSTRSSGKQVWIRKLTANARAKGSTWRRNSTTASC